MYQLLIETPDGVWRNADLGSESPAFNYEMNDVAELKDRQASYSQSITLPMTNNNVRIFANLNSPQVPNSLPYGILNCRLFYNNAPLAGRGSVLKILSITSTSIKVQVLGSIADLFEALKNLSFSTIVEEGTDDILGVQRIPVADKKNQYLSVADGVGMNDEVPSGSGIYPYGRPSISLYEAVKKVLKKVGYTLTGTDGDARNIYLFPKDRKIFNPLSIFGTYGGTMVDGYDGEQRGVEFFQPYELGEDAYMYIDYRLSVRKNSLPVDDNGTSIYFSKGKKLRLCLSYGGNYDVIFNDGFWDSWRDSESVQAWTSNWQSDSLSYYKRIRIYNSGRIDEIDDAGNVLQTFNSASYSFKQRKTIGIYNSFQSEWDSGYVFDKYGTANIEKYGFSIAVRFGIDTGLEYAQQNQFISMTNNLGLSDANELVKLYCQLYGLVAVVNHTNNTVQFYSMNRLYERKEEARDWSSKLEKGSEERSFILGNYAQLNNIKAKENKQSSYTYQWSFAVENTNIKSSADLFTMNLLSTSGNTINYLSVDTDKEGNVTRKVVALDAPAIMEMGTDGYLRGVDLDAIVSKAYAPILKMLQKAQVITAQFYLTQQDLQDFDHFVPVYLSQYGAYFYVNKISNFIVGKLTSVELVRM